MCLAAYACATCAFRQDTKWVLISGINRKFVPTLFRLPLKIENTNEVNNDPGTITGTRGALVRGVKEWLVASGPDHGTIQCFSCGKS